MVDTHGINQPDNTPSDSGEALWVDLFDQLGATIGSPLFVSSVTNPYHSYQAPWADLTLSSFSTTTYFQTVSNGEASLRGMIDGYVTGCGPKTKIILTGHSEGAQVTGNVYQSLNKTELKSVVAVALFADPRLNHKDRSTTITTFQQRVDAPLARDGLMEIFNKPGIRRAFNSPGVLSYCHPDDPICQDIAGQKNKGIGGVNPVTLGAALLTGTHSAYVSRADASDAASYLAKYLVSLDNPPTSANFSYSGPCINGSTAVDTQLPFSDSDGDSFNAVIFGTPDPSSGTLSVAGERVLTANLGVTLGWFEWAPGASSTVIPFSVQDSHGAISGTYHLTLSASSSCAPSGGGGSSAVTLVSSQVDGTPFTGNVGMSAVNPSGRYVAFTAAIPNAIGDDVSACSGAMGVFLKDLTTGDVQLLSLHDTYSDCDSRGDLTWSPDGSKLAFLGELNYAPEIFVFDLASHSLTIESSDANGVPASPQSGAGWNATEPIWSPDGSSIAFYSGARNLVSGTYPSQTGCHLFVKNIVTGNILLLDRSGSGAISDGDAGCNDGNTADENRPTWSPDSSAIAFSSTGTNLGTSNLTGIREIYRVNASGGAPTLVSGTSSGGPANADAVNPVWSPDGGSIDFQSAATNLDPRLTANVPNWQYIFVKRLLDGAMTVGATDTSGAPTTAQGFPAWTTDGSGVIWASAFPATDGLALTTVATGSTTILNPSGPCSGSPSPYYLFIDPFHSGLRIAFETSVGDCIYDSGTGTSFEAGTASDGTAPNGGSFAPSWSPDGRLAITSYASNLIPSLGLSSNQGEVYLVSG